MASVRAVAPRAARAAATFAAMASARPVSPRAGGSPRAHPLPGTPCRTAAADRPSRVTPSAPAPASLARPRRRSTLGLAHLPRALPPGSALASHPLMAVKTGTYGIADFDLVVDEIPLGEGRPVAKIVRPASEDEVLDMYVALGLLDHDPYWAALWPSSIALARGVAAAAAADTSGDDSGNSVVGRDACDLGAGLGLAGIAAALCGARSVVFYDREPLALQCCLLSAELNGLTVRAGGAQEDVDGDGDGDDAAGFDGPSTTCSASAEMFDWNAVPADQRTFDLVLACDVLYESHAVAPVASLVPKLTVPGGGRWLLADPPNRAPKNRARFRELVAGDATLLGEPREESVTHRGSTDAVLLLDFVTR